MTIEESYPLTGNGTTFERCPTRYYGGESVITHFVKRVKEGKKRAGGTNNYHTKLSEIPAFTTFEILKSAPPSDEIVSALAEDFEFYIPLKPKHSFKLKAKIKSVSKFTPKPFFD